MLTTLDRISPILEALIAECPPPELDHYDYPQGRMLAADYFREFLRRIPVAPNGAEAFVDVVNPEAIHRNLSPHESAQLARIILASHILTTRKAKATHGPRRSEFWFGWAHICSTAWIYLTAGTISIGRDDLLDFMEMCCDILDLCHGALPFVQITRWLESYLATGAMDTEFLDQLKRFRERVAVDQFPNHRSLVPGLDSLMGEDVLFGLSMGEPWADHAIDDLNKVAAPKVEAWRILINHARTAKGSKPSARWIEKTRTLLEPIDMQEYAETLRPWLKKVGQPRPKPDGAPIAGIDLTLLSDMNSDVLKGLVWACGLLGDEITIRTLGDLALVCFKKVPGVGPRSGKVGNACLFALSQIANHAAILQISRIKQLAKFVPARRMAEKALSEAAHQLGISVTDAEELAVPTFDLNPDGRMTKLTNGFSLELAIVGTTQVDLRVVKPNGSIAKSIPKIVKDNDSETVKTLKFVQKQIGQTLPAQRQRIEAMLRSPRTLSVSEWRSRYLDHPLVGQMCRRLIWQFDNNGHQRLGAWLSGELVDSADSPISLSHDADNVQLWHPIGSNATIVQAWRKWLNKHEITQPFKQAHREIYLVTDTEVESSIYSNRFAGHIVRYSQVRALAQQRGWAAGTLVVFDPTYNKPPSISLSDWQLRAEYWLDGAGDDYNDAGMFNFAQTDQVRFYASDRREPLILNTIPQRIFSEIMRDVDLFVGVCSIGNDPNWADRGTIDPFAQYWHDYSFGELRATAHTRRELLSQLIPRLSIAACCKLSDRFLVVRGQFRTYKIHLGSSNIQMEPNDKYLCIVADRSGPSRDTTHSRIFLPFEGDTTLALILSKAFMLANDSAISDPTILKQINSEI